LSPVLHADTVRGMTRQFIHTFSFTFVFCLVSTFPLSAALTVRGRSPVAEKLVAAVIRADYQGDRAALARLETELGAVPKNPATDARVTYWRGFALWRRTINGFNDSTPPAELDADLVRAIAHFDDSAKQDPSFAEPVIGKLSCLGYRAFLARGNASLSSEILAEYKTAIAAGQRMARDNPRFVWAVGPSQRLRKGIGQLMNDLGREDRLKLILFNMRVARTIDFTRDVKAVEEAIRAARAGGGTALLDTVSVALVSSSHPDRRQLIVVFTDGSDSSSITGNSTLTSVAQRTRATLTFVMPGTIRPTITSGNRVITLPIAPLFSAPSPIFTTLARETGGTILPVGSGSDLSAAFRGVLNDFRSCYVLFYSAQGVDREGYHAIEVKVKREGAVVSARRGYFGS
jgi:von Willebrand factor type A domain